MSDIYLLASLKRCVAALDMVVAEARHQHEMCITRRRRLPADVISHEKSTIASIWPYQDAARTAARRINSLEETQFTIQAAECDRAVRGAALVAGLAALARKELEMYISQT
jgi:hypothetical protein